MEFNWIAAAFLEAILDHVDQQHSLGVGKQNLLRFLTGESLIGFAKTDELFRSFIDHRLLLFRQSTPGGGAERNSPVHKRRPKQNRRLLVGQANYRFTSLKDGGGPTCGNQQTTLFVRFGSNFKLRPRPEKACIKLQEEVRLAQN